MHKLTGTFTALTLIAGLSAGDASAADPRTIDQLANSLMQQTATATREVRFGFQNSPQYTHLYKDVYDMYCAAEHIHDVAHVAGNQAHILHDVEQLDELVHHVQELIDAISGPPSFDLKRGGQPLHGHQGHAFHGASEYHLRRLNAMVDGIAHTMHDLQDVVGYSRPLPPALPGAAPVVIPRPPVVLPRTPVNRRPGIEILRGRRGGLSLSIGLR